MKRTPLALAAVTFLFATAQLSARIIHVPSEAATIQSAILSAVNGDTVLVAPGTYYENLNLRGRNIVLASNYILALDRSFINATVINGSTPANPDTGSCVIIASGEDTTATLVGFTLTGGVGTRWQDKHILGYYREGGGVLIENASPTIRNNRIIGNAAVNTTNVTSAGGGAIRCDGGRPLVLNNIIMSNQGRYGAGIVLNYTGAIIRNNIICNNTGGEDFGGSGIWANQNGSSAKVYENNVIAGNASVLPGGGLYFSGTTATGRNNIIWANTSLSTGAQISGTLTLEYSDVQGGYAGTGIINVDPIFADSCFLLQPGSPCIDAGNPAGAYNDPENPSMPGAAAWPSGGSTRNDIGAYGGPGASVLPFFSAPEFVISSDSVDFGNILPGYLGSVTLTIANGGASVLVISSAQIAGGMNGTITPGRGLPFSVRPLASDTMSLVWAPAAGGFLRDTLLLHHNDPSLPDPQKIVLAGNSNPTPALYVTPAIINFGFVNINTQQRDTTFFVYNRGTAPDSVYIALDPDGVNPVSAVSLAPSAMYLVQGDSAGVTYAMYPNQMIKKSPPSYTLTANIVSRFGIGTTHFAKSIRFNLTGSLSVTGRGDLPSATALLQNFPNPFNPTTTIAYRVSAQGAITPHVRITVYDILGRIVAQLVDADQPAGEYSLIFDAREVSSGVYSYRLEVSSGGRGGSASALVRKMLVVK